MDFWKWSFPLRIYSVNVTKSAEKWYLVTFTEEILNEKLHFCAVQKQLSTCVEKSWSENCFQYSQEIISLQLHQNITPVQVFSFKSEKLFRRFFLAAKYSGWLFLFKLTYHLNVFFPSLIFWGFIWTASAFLFRV